MGSGSTARSAAAESVLAVVDSSLLIAGPLLVVSVAIGLPAISVFWAIGGALVMGVTAALALLGRYGRARWRGVVYVLVTLTIAITALWTMGPLTGVGVMFGLSILCAGAFLSRRALVAVVAVAIAAIVMRLLIGGGGRLEIELSLWIGTAFASATMLWIAVRILTALTRSLERSYSHAADAYRLETETREQLDSSRHELEELAQVELVGRLAGGVAHDVNNALAVILAAIDVLTTEVATPDQRRHLAELEAASLHAADLVRDLLWTGRRFPASTTAGADLGAVARVCLERVARVARKVTVDVQIEHAIKLGISPEHLEQILFGLIVGAGRSGVRQLAFTTARAGGTADLVLAGVAEDSASEAGHPRAMQVQLSVSAARELAGQYGGALTVSDEASRLRVVLSLPIAAGQRDVAPVAAPPIRTALVVEDEPMVLRRLCQLVARRGYEVSSATTVAEGMALLAALPDLLITDLQLPDGSGEAIALASFEQSPARPIIVCSGFSADDVRRGRLRDAPLTFLAKPFTSADFDAAIANPMAAVKVA
jgi:two-component system, cell cycle sensor histidine kinase and response regulator CckA